LSDLWSKHRELFGNIEGDVFLVLVKIIDAKEDLRKKMDRFDSST
jgi:mannose-6-phosphate isomerase class I